MRHEEHSCYCSLGILLRLTAQCISTQYGIKHKFFEFCAMPAFALFPASNWHFCEKAEEYLRWSLPRQCSTNLAWSFPQVQGFAGGKVFLLLSCFSLEKFEHLVQLQLWWMFCVADWAYSTKQATGLRRKDEGPNHRDDRRGQNGRPICQRAILHHNRQQRLHQQLSAHGICYFTTIHSTRVRRPSHFRIRQVVEGNSALHPYPIYKLSENPRETRPLLKE